MSEDGDSDPSPGASFSRLPQKILPAALEYLNKGLAHALQPFAADAGFGSVLVIQELWQRNSRKNKEEEL